MTLGGVCIIIPFFFPLNAFSEGESANASAAILDNLSQASADTLNQRFRVLEGSAAAQPTTGKVAGRKAVRLHCNFQSRSSRRATWELPVHMDLTMARGIKFQFHAENLTGVSRLSFYFRSGNGWYAKDFWPEDVGEWSTINVLKADTRQEGGPSGWDNIEKLRLSVWRGGNKDINLATRDFRKRRARTSILIVRGNGKPQRAPQGAAQYVHQAARNVDFLLRSYGLHPRFTEAQDLTRTRLKGVKAVILPYNPGLSHSKALLLKNYLERGGKVVGFFTLPSSLSKPAGIASVTHVGADKLRDRLEGMSFKEEDVVPGLPAFVEQDTGNLNIFEPIQDKGVGVGRWRFRDGKYLDAPVFIKSANTFWVSYILKNSTLPQGGRLLLSLLGDLFPDLWETAATYRLHNLGNALRHGSYAAAFQNLTKRAQQDNNRAAIRTLLRSRKSLKISKRFLKQRQAINALKYAHLGKSYLHEAYYRSQQAQAGQAAAIWVQADKADSLEAWRDVCTRLNKLGFNAVMLETEAWKPASESRQQLDQNAISEYAEIAHNNSLQLHAWVNCFRRGSHTSDHTKLARTNTGRALRDWLSPGNPVNRKTVLQEIIRIASVSNIDGIHLDYVRYPNAHAGFGGDAKSRFEQYINQSVDEWPASVLNEGDFTEQWWRFKCRMINLFVKKAHRVASQSQGDLSLSAAVFGEAWNARHDLGQDWGKWAEKGWMDFLCPMNYTESPGKFRALLKRQVRITQPTRTALYPGIGLTPRRLSPVEMIEQIKLTREFDLPGFVIFKYTPRAGQTVLTNLSKGIISR